MSKILILAPHPDDEVLSFGGLIIKSLLSNHEVRIVFFTCGGPCSNVLSELRYEELRNVMNYLGVTNYYVGGPLDGRLDTIPNCQLTSRVDQEIADYEPDEVYCSPDSEHSDHHSLYKAFLASARLKSGFMPRSFYVGTYPFSDQLYQSPPGGKVFNPLTDQVFKKKVEAFKLYESQQKPSPNPLGVDGLVYQTNYNGMLCGFEYAELYYLLRVIRPL